METKGTQVSTVFDDMADDFDAVAASKPAVHPFQAAGLGQSPFKCVGCIDRGRAEGKCNYCGHAIRYEFEIVSADGKKHVVGSDCIELVRGDVIGFKHFGRELHEKKAKAAAERKIAKLAAAAAEYRANHPDVTAWLEANRLKSSFAGSLMDAIARYGALTEGRERAVKNAIARDATREAERVHARQVAALNAPVADTARLEKAFAAARSNGLKYPKITMGEITFVPASANSRYPGAIFVKGGRAFEAPYYGRIEGGKFFKSGQCSADQEKVAMALVNDPQKAVEAYGQLTGNCAICNRLLTDPESVKRGIGPICADRFGW